MAGIVHENIKDKAQASSTLAEGQAEYLHDQATGNIDMVMGPVGGGAPVPIASGDNNVTVRNPGKRPEVHYAPAAALTGTNFRTGSFGTDGLRLPLVGTGSKFTSELTLGDIVTLEGSPFARVTFIKDDTTIHLLTGANISQNTDFASATVRRVTSYHSFYPTPADMNEFIQRIVLSRKEAAIGHYPADFNASFLSGTGLTVAGPNDNQGEILGGVGNNISLESIAEAGADAEIKVAYQLICSRLSAAFDPADPPIREFAKFVGSLRGDYNPATDTATVSLLASPGAAANLVMDFGTSQAGAKIELKAGNLGLRIEGGNVFFDNLPTSDPAVAGAWWNNNGVPNISTG